MKKAFTAKRYTTREKLFNSLDYFACNDKEFVIQRAKPEESQNHEVLRFAQDDGRFSLAPMREREELLSERSELSNSGEGCKELPSPDASRHPLPREGNKVSCAKHTEKVFSPFNSHFSQLCTPHPSPLPQGEREQLSCAEHTVKHLFSYSPIHLFTSKKAAFTKPSRGTSEARDEFQSTKMLNFRCWNERCRLTRGAAFTLAEVLITLGIIGIIAAMTLPTLVKNYQKHVYYNQFRKAASALENAYKLYELDNGCEGNILNCKKSFGAEDIIPYFNVAQKISRDNWVSICNGNDLCEDSDCTSSVDNEYFAFITNDGVLYNFGADYGLGCASIMDINGPMKGPNELGRDIFVFYRPGWNNNQHVVWGGNESYFGSENSLCDINGVDKDGCATKLLQEGKMNY